MTPEEVLASLVELARRTGIRVRFDELEARGGLCIVHGGALVLLDVRAPVGEQAEILAAALSRFGVVPMYVPRGARNARANARVPTRT